MNSFEGDGERETFLNKWISHALALWSNPLGSSASKRLPTDAADWYAADNQFGSVRRLDRAHRPIVRLALRVLENRPGNVIDLGCGNGALLRKIARNRQISVFGVDIEQSRIEHAHLLLPEFRDNFRCGDLFDNDWIWPAERRYALALLSPARLVEAGPQAAARLKERLAHRCDQILLYKYGWRLGSLQQLAEQTGMRLVYSEKRVGLALVHLN